MDQSLFSIQEQENFISKLFTSVWSSQKSIGQIEKNKESGGNLTALTSITTDKSENEVVTMTYTPYDQEIAQSKTDWRFRVIALQIYI